MSNALHRHLVASNPRAVPMDAFFKTGDDKQRLTLFYVEIEPFKVRYFAYTKEGGEFTIGNRPEVQAFLAKCYEKKEYGYEEQMTNALLTLEQHQRAEAIGLDLIHTLAVGDKPTTCR